MPTSPTTKTDTGMAHTAHDHDVYDYPDDVEDEFDPGDECGRWDNGRLGRHCALAGTEFCDFECPYGD